ncbi:hypothetical protein [Bradyrhizobium sp. S3.2.12]|uniref:hypothetical protein n=1 Tax=Bradyrhizobium sp. S3.2.12 TaxID=3156387 RepID=UPI0033962EAC
MNTTDMGGSGFTIASAAAGLIKTTLSNVKVINAASGIGVGAGTRSASSKSADRSTCPTTTFLRYVGTRFDGLRKI